ncbi:MAG: cation:proton antiporter, partial [Butyricicoccus sp.]|nr:cation:proton antiporter [Butyricicoccus sp.]
VLGAVLSAVSPAVVVPRLVHLIETRWGTEKSIPQMILAGASLDDVFVIVLFSTFVGMEQGGTASVLDLLQVPVAIVLGVALGLVTGWLLARFFEGAAARGQAIRSSMKVLVVMGVAFLLLAAEEALENVVSLSGLLAVMSMACALRGSLPGSVSARLSEKFGKLWIAAEVILFVLVGAAVDVRYTLAAGIPALCLLVLSLGLRSVGVFLCMLGTPLHWKERLFCVLAYLPKATVQAAIGSVPLALGLPCGKIVLSVAVLAIVVTAPLGALAIDRSYQKLLQHQK